VVSAFHRTFLLGLAAAILCGALVVSMVLQSERLARQRARFAASAAHELRTPLAGLRMYGEMLADGSGDSTRQEHYGRRVAGEAERLGRVVSNLLGFARLERGDLRICAVEGDLSEAVRTSVEQLRPTLEANGATLEVAIEPSGPARFDRDAVHQILQNLLDNADKFTRSADDRTIRVELTSVDGGARLSVSDRGPGVEPSVKRRLFEAFVRHPSPDAPDGLGLGLTLVQALARAQDAAVEYVEVAGGGSRFDVTFPGPA
jgi:signal transduction histidine kinase